MKKHKFIVEIEIPEGCNITEMKHFIKSSISSMGGPYSCGDSLFELNLDSIKVVHATRAKAAELLGEFINKQKLQEKKYDNSNKNK